MQLITTTKGTVTYHYREFDSISEFMEFIEGTPLNSVFRWESLSSTEKGKRYWYNTNSWEDAQERLKHGDKALAEKLTGFMKLTKHPENKLVQKPSYSMAGYQASVPRYLQGVPDSMIAKKQVVQKQKVITITKNIGYTAGFSAQDIIDEAITAVKLINTIEARGVRCNLYVSSIAQAFDNVAVGFRIKVKGSNERTNMSKLAFPLANPSMLRRFSFRYREVAPETTQSFRGSYGTSVQTPELFTKRSGEYYIPTMVSEQTAESLLDSLGLK